MDTNPTEFNKELVRRQADAINARDLELLAETTAPDFVRHCQATPGIEITNLEGFGEFLQADWASFPDSVLTISQLVAEGDRVAMWATYEATQTGPMGPFPAGGKKMSLDIAGIFRIADDKVAEIWATWDNLTALTQLGHMPPPPGS